MKIHVIKTPFEFLIIDDFYDGKELEKIWSELQFLTPKFLPSNEKNSSISASGEIGRNSTSIFLDIVYSDRNFSDVLSLNRKIFCEQIQNELLQFSPLYREFFECYKDSTLINYYEDNGYYKPHYDESMFSAVTFLYREPKKYQGGDFVFCDYDLKIESLNNRMILFPSKAVHAVSPLSLLEKNKGYGRYSISQFLLCGNKEK
jgi:Rps23 Pro-64 3,4-dihydroxylase Tpa1-like proline 4-hydroxylase